MMHELETAETGAGADDPEQRLDVARWRRAERKRQLDRRLALDRELRRRHATQIAERLELEIGRVRGMTVSAYWPVRGEPDLRPLLRRLVSGGVTCALPVVVEVGQPLAFRGWVPGERLERGVWGIPVPSNGAAVKPDVIIAPVVAFDDACYRLGYGGGYFDRTLAAMGAEPRVFGVGYSFSAVPTIYPQLHDIPMGAIVTEASVFRSKG